MNEKMNAGIGRFRQKVLAFMRKNHMTDRGDSVLAAVSGGADSVCLLLLLHEMAAELGIKVFAFHMNHGIRGAEADRDEQFVMELCERLNIPLTVAHEKVEEYAAERGLSGEEAGRILRYHHLGETAEKYQCAKIAVAHHEDDDAETVLLNLFRGSGLAGLSGIRPVRENIIRPLLCVSRKEIEGYLNEQELSWCEDSTNKENDYTRNKIRNELLPWVTENINSRAAEHILAVSEFAAQADAYFEMEAERILEESCSKRREEGKQPNSKNAGEADGKESAGGNRVRHDDEFQRLPFRFYPQCGRNINHRYYSGYSGGVFLLAGLKEYAHSVHIHHSVAGRYVCLPGGCGIQSEYPDTVCTGACHWYGGGRCHCGGGSGAVQI